MDQALNWYKAITLDERISALHAQRQAKEPTACVNSSFEDCNIDSWSSSRPSKIDSYFFRRLTASGITENEFKYLLCEPIEMLRRRFEYLPEEIEELATAFARPDKPNESSFCLPIIEGSNNMDQFLCIIEPVINQGREKLHLGIQEITQAQRQLPFDPNTIEDLFYVNLQSRLLLLLSRTLALELNVASLEGRLVGDTSVERFRSFIAFISQHDIAIEILQEYPVLARQIIICIQQWIRSSLEFLRRLCTDWENIMSTFSSDSNPGLLEDLDTEGDAHRNGRSVMTARFSSGFRIVYKPRSLKVDVHFQELLLWLNNRGASPLFHTMKILDYGTYGWEEFIAPMTCTSSEEINSFYKRLGGYLAILYALEATDFHFENIIASGEHPYLLDLEAIFHPRVKGFDLGQANQIALDSLSHSVLRVGLLPLLRSSNTDTEEIDFSGLGTIRGKLTPFAVPQWEGIGTDMMQLVRKRVQLRGSKNQPTLNDINIKLVDYVDDMISGFTAIYRLILKNLDKLLTNTGPLSRFSEDEVRIIFRPTQTYMMLLYESFHPDVLRDALDRDLLFGNLWKLAEYHSHLSQIIPAETDELQKCDIPIFITHPNSHDLSSGSGKMIANFFDESGLARVRRHIMDLSEDDLKKQLWFIRASLATMSRSLNQVQVQHPIDSLTKSHTNNYHESLLQIAQIIGDQLERLAIHGEEDATWIGLKLASKEQWSLVPLEIDLYDGLPGVTLFLAYLGSVTNNKRYTLLAQAAFTNILQQIERDRSSITKIGGFDGWGGIIYTLTHLALLWNKPWIIAETEKIIAILPDLINQDEWLDIIGGAAGCIGSLLSLYRFRPTKSVLTTAIQCADRLVTRAKSMGSGTGWVNPITTKKPLIGFSHGTAGIAWALLEIADLTGRPSYRNTALSSIEYERSVFSTKENNWPDLRGHADPENMSNDDQNHFTTTWCHGAPGIGLSRLHMLKHINDPVFYSEIEIAIKTTLSYGFDRNHCLCHGGLGNLELLLQASKTLDRPDWKINLRRSTSNILDGLSKNGWRCGNPLGVESPGLMTGIAGIGYELLRLAEPTRIPSILLLEPPYHFKDKLRPKSSKNG